MSGQLHHYDPDAVDCIVFFAPISGFGEDDAIDFDPGDAGFEVVKGVDGDYTRTKKVGALGELTLTLMQTSRSNAILSGVYAADIAANGGAGVGAVLIKDRNGTSFLECDTAWIIAPPPVKYGSKPSPRVWKIQLVNYTQYEGGT